MRERTSVVFRSSCGTAGTGAKPAIPFALGLLLLTAASSVFAEEQRQVAVLDLVHFNGTRPARNLLEKERFESAFARSLEVAGWSVLQATDEGCNEGVDCLAAVAKRLGVSRVVRMTGQGNAQLGYQLNIEAFRPNLARTEKGTLYCDTCNQTRAAELAAEDAQKQLAAVARAAGSAEDTPAPPVLAAPEPLPEADRSIVTPPASDQHASYRWVPWTLIGTGAAALAVGGWALYENGKTAGDVSVRDGQKGRSSYSSAAIGTACLIAGGVAVISGTIWLLATPSSQTGIAASPNHVALHVRF